MAFLISYLQQAATKLQEFHCLHNCVGHINVFFMP